MQYTETSRGRTFVLRLEHGDVVHETIEGFAREQNISAAALIVLGGADTGSRLVVGPEEDESRPVNPMVRELGHVHEVAGTGTLFPDEEGEPVLHMHMACGRQDQTTTGCIRAGVRTWQILEVVLFELVGASGLRRKDPNLGFSLLSF
jgi:predicted DNA-binding protein with PD1-like motif